LIVLHSKEHLQAWQALARLMHWWRSDRKLTRNRQQERTSFHRASAAADPRRNGRDTETAMNAKQNVKSSNSIEQQLSSINLSEQQRRQALHEAHIAEAFVEVLTWVGSRLGRPRASVFSKPSPNY
jgi:hypothetical protein